MEVSGVIMIGCCCISFFYHFCDSSSVDRVSPFQGEGRGFEPLLSLCHHGELIKRYLTARKDGRFAATV